MESFFRYPGSKVVLTAEYQKLWLNHNHFVDVFGGSGAVILNKERSAVETFNDIDPAIYNLFRIVRDGQLSALQHMVEHTPHRCRRCFEEARGVVEAGDPDPVRSAWAWLYLTDNSVVAKGPAVATASNWGYYRTAYRANNWPTMKARIERVHSRFRKVQLTNWDWSRVLNSKRHEPAGLDDPDTLFFLDPSYYPPAMGKSRIYRHQMSVADHHQMLNRIRQVEGYVFLCGYPHPDYDNALSGWHTREFPTSTNMAMRGKASPRIEKVWMNYDPDTGERI